MKVNSNITFKGFYTNKTLKKGLEFAADNGALFAAGTTLACSMLVRPAVIMATPNTDKQNKKIACAKSIASSLTGYLLMLGISRPIANSIKKIDKNPEKYLKPETIKNLKEEGENLYKSKAYTLATQTFKLGLGMVVALPKAILTVAGVPIVLNKIFPQKQEKVSPNPSFKGKNDKIAQKIGRIIDQKGTQDFSKKYKDSNFPMHIIALTDVFSTGAFALETKRSKKIEENRKNALIYNSIISTGLSIISGYLVDKLLDKPTEKFIENFKKANKGLPNLEKQVEGIRIAKPILIMAGIYYAIIPFISTYLADRVEFLKK